MTVHKNGDRESAALKTFKKVLHPNIIPIWDDSSNYCRPCEQQYKYKGTYQNHVRRIHKDVLLEAVKLSRPSPAWWPSFLLKQLKYI